MGFESVVSLKKTYPFLDLSVEAIRGITGPFLTPASEQCLFRKSREQSTGTGLSEHTQSPVVSEACPQTICLLVKF